VKSTAAPMTIGLPELVAPVLEPLPELDAEDDDDELLLEEPQPASAAAAAPATTSDSHVERLSGVLLISVS
jgi:hypothetical protein